MLSDKECPKTLEYFVAFRWIANQISFRSFFKLLKNDFHGSHIINQIRLQFLPDDYYYYSN